MKYDYLKNHKHKPRKPWWDEKRTKKEQSAIYQTILKQPSILGSTYEANPLNEKELYKHTVLEMIPFDLAAYQETGSFTQEPSILLAYYNPSTNEPTIFTAKWSTIEDQLGA